MLPNESAASEARCVSNRQISSWIFAGLTARIFANDPQTNKLFLEMAGAKEGQFDNTKKGCYVR